MRFSIKQKGEYEKLKDLLKFAGPDKKWGCLSNPGGVAVHSVDSIKMLKKLIEYLEKYPLRSSKGIAYAK